MNQALSVISVFIIFAFAVKSQHLAPLLRTERASMLLPWMGEVGVNTYTLSLFSLLPVGGGAMGVVEPGTFIKPHLLGERDTALERPPKFLFQKEACDIWIGETEIGRVLTWSQSTIGATQGL